MAKKKPNPIDDIEGDDDVDDLVGPPSAGDNSDKADDGPTVSSSTVAAKQLQSIIERIERLEEDKKAVADDIKEVYAESKANGFDNKTIRKIIARRKKDREEVAEEDALLDLYLSALGMI